MLELLAPNARWREEVVSQAPKAGGVKRRPDPACPSPDTTPITERSDGLRPRRLDWASLLKRTFRTDVLTCQ